MLLMVHSATRRVKSSSNVQPSEKLRILLTHSLFQVLTDRYGIRMTVIMPNMHSFICVYTCPCPVLYEGLEFLVNPSLLLVITIITISTFLESHYAKLQRQ